MKAVFVVGEPGCGKTTLVRRFLGLKDNGELPHGGYLVPSPKWTVIAPLHRLGVVAAGHYTGSDFDGADTVPYNGVSAAMAWLLKEQLYSGFAVFDGDRFSNSTVLAQLRLADIEMVCVHLTLPDDIAKARRQRRAALAGTKIQNAAWVKGRKTKAQNFADKFDPARCHTYYDLDGLDLHVILRQHQERAPRV